MVFVLAILEGEVALYLRIGGVYSFVIVPITQTKNEMCLTLCICDGHAHA